MSSKKHVKDVDFCERLEAVIKKVTKSDRGKSKFAKIIGVSGGYLSDIVNGRSGPSYSLLFGIAKKLPGIDINWLITGEGTPYIKERRAESAGDKGTDKALDTSKRPPHTDLVKLFVNDPDLAWAINWDLLKIDRKAPATLEEIWEFVKFKLQQLEIENTECHPDRRQSDDPDQAPENDGKMTGKTKRRSNAGR